MLKQRRQPNPSSFQRHLRVQLQNIVSRNGKYICFKKLIILMDIYNKCLEEDLSDSLGCLYPNETNNSTLVQVKVNGTFGNSSSSSLAEIRVPQGSEAVYRCRDELRFQLDGNAKRYCYQTRWILDMRNLSSTLLPPQCRAWGS